MLFPLVQTTDRLINQLQNSIAQALRPFMTNPVNQGNLVLSQALVIGDNIINHGLNRPIQGYMIVSASLASSFYDNIQSVPNQTKSFVLNSSAAVTVNIYCF